MTESREFRTCSKCGESKPVAEFHKDNHTPTGLTYRCKDCNRAATVVSRLKRVEQARAVNSQWG
jgi:ribosomal protein L44E